MAAEPGPIQRCLAEDHPRLEGLLARSVPPGGGLVRGPFDAFRAGLLRHVNDGPRVLRTAEAAQRVSAKQFEGH